MRRNGGITEIEHSGAISMAWTLRWQGDIVAQPKRGKVRRRRNVVISVPVTLDYVRQLDPDRTAVFDFSDDIAWRAGG
jgi:hypothetical protein